MAPESTSVPLPFLVNPKLVPDITPPTVKLLPSMLRVRVAFIVTAPVPKFRSPVPAKAKSPFQFWVLLLVSVLAMPLVLSIVPPLILKTLAAVPSALSLLMASVPLLSVVLPV